MSLRKSVVQSACQYDVTSASLTFEMASKVFIEETDKNFEFFKECYSDFLDFEILRSPLSLKTRHRNAQECINLKVAIF